MLRIYGNRISCLAGVSYAALIGCSFSFLLLLLSLLFVPATLDNHVAAIESDSNISTYATTPSVSINLPSLIDFASVTPTPNGATSTATANLTVTTTNSASYSLYLYSSDGDNSLSPKTSANTSSIIATAGGAGLTLSSLKSNTWGYHLGTSAPDDDTTYTAVPIDNSSPIQTKDTSSTNSANDTYTLSFGAKVDSTIPSGIYSNALTVAVVAEPKAISNWSELTTMQEMTPAICDTAKVGDTKQLVDERDNKQYWVAKLADDNCWMTQNLDLDLSTSKTLTSEDSDVSSDWTPTHSTSKSIYSNTMTTEQYSWDPGYWVKADPSNYNDYCGESGSFNIKSFSDNDCLAAGWTSVTSMTPMSDGSTNNSISGNTYNAHYLVGNFYHWNAATAGTGNTTALNSNAPDSICPKGWHLPTFNNSDKGSIAYLLSQYDINGSTVGDIVKSPLFLNPSGNVAHGSLARAGEGGYLWLATAYSDIDHAYRLDFYLAGHVNSVYGGSRWAGVPIRCLATAE